MERITINDARPLDAKNLINYLKKVVNESDFLRYYEDEIKIGVKDEESYIKMITSQENSKLIVARYDGKIAGVASLQGQQYRKFKHTAELGISVLKEYQGLGIGKQLMVSLLGWANESQILKKINLHVNVENKIAIDLYKKFGFCIEGKITNDFFYQNRYVDTFFMGLNL